MNEIFISYRRQDSSAIVGRVIDRLETNFGKEHIFRDLDSIGYGQDFDEVIGQTLMECKVLLVVIGDEWEQVKDKHGIRRLNKPDDWVRLEVSKAFKQSVHLIPVLVEDAKMPSAGNLPEDIRGLATRNAAKVRNDPDFDVDIERLCSTIEKQLSSNSAEPREHNKSHKQNKITNNSIPEEAGLQYLWSAIASFNMIYILNLWLLDRTNQLLIGIFHFDDTRESAPIFGLSFGTLVTILSFNFMLSLVKRNTSEQWMERVPHLWVDIDVKSQLGRTWRHFIVSVTLLFPIAAQLHFWFQLYERQVWENNSQSKLHGIWSYVSPKYFLDWDAYRYGDHSKRLIEEGFGGVSFLPFWQPVIMVVLTAIALALFGRIVLAFREPRYEK